MRTAGGWTISGNTATNAALIQFPQCGATGATITYVGIGVSPTAGDSGLLLFSGQLGSSLAVAYVGLSGGTITIDSTCTGGTIVISGIGTVVNESALTLDMEGLAVSLVAAEATPIHADVKKQNAATVYGSGTSGDKWRGTP